MIQFLNRHGLTELMTKVGGALVEMLSAMGEGDSL